MQHCWEHNSKKFSKTFFYDSLRAAEPKREYARIHMILMTTTVGRYDKVEFPPRKILSVENIDLQMADHETCVV